MTLPKKSLKNPSWSYQVEELPTREERDLLTEIQYLLRWAIGSIVLLILAGGFLTLLVWVAVAFLRSLNEAPNWIQ